MLRDSKSVFTTLVLVGLTNMWYVSSMLSASSSKMLLKGIETGGLVFALSPLELTCLQVWMAGAFAALASVLTNRSVGPLVPVSLESVWDVIFLSFSFSLGFITLNLAYSTMSASLANTLRAMEPLSSLFLSRFIDGKPVSSAVMLSVLPIVIGASMASYGNLDFSWEGLLYVIVANFAFAYRIFQYKSIRDRFMIDHATLFSQCCFFSGIMLTIVLLILDSTWFWTQVAHFGENSTYDVLETIVVNGSTFWLYLQLSFVITSFVNVITHAVLNSFRRPAIILFDVAKFGTKLSTINMVGVMCACLGVVAYSVMKARPVRTKET